MNPPIEIPDVGQFVFDESCGWYNGPTVELGHPDGKSRKFRVVLVDDYSQHKSSIARVVENLRRNSQQALHVAERAIFMYYENSKEYYGDEEGFPIITRDSDIWNFIEFGSDLNIMIRAEDQKFYVMAECSCAWEVEHGLQIVLREGLVVNKVGPFDGHLTNSDAYDKPEYEDVIYVS